MKLILVSKHLARVAIMLFAAMLMPLFLPAQSKKTTSSPPPPVRTAPATPVTRQPAQPPAQHAPAPTGVKPSTTTPAPKSDTNTTKSNAHGTMTPNKPNTGTPTGSPSSASVKLPGSVISPAGGKMVTTKAGNSLVYNKSGQLNKVVTRSGSEAHFDSRGKVSFIKTANGTTIMPGHGGQPQVVTEHRDVSGHLESRVVSTGPHRGYVEHTFQRGGNEYMRRTYINGGRTNVNVYRGYSYRGVVYYHYVPAYYYHPVFYGWAYRPWSNPVYYTWGWYGAPWYAFYGYYFTPYPVYSTATFWLTDYVIAVNLHAAYEAGAASAAGAGNPGDAQTHPAAPQPVQSDSPTLTPEVKQMIAEEVTAQLAAEQAAAARGGASSPAPTAPPQPANTDQAPAALDPNLRLFIVATNLDVTADGQACSLTPGDVLMRTENTPDKDNTVGVNVVSSKKSDCNMGSSPRVQIADLQEMHNHFREQMDAGLKALADNQGTNGIPSGPDANPRQNPDGQAAVDLTAAVDLQNQQNDADDAEKEIRQACSSASNVGSACAG
jgi:hypothetical protein